MDDSWNPDFGQLATSVPEWAPKRPTRIAVLGDFSGGAASGRLDTGSDLAKRKMMPVEFDTLEDALGRLNPTLTLPIGTDGAGVEITFSDLDSFHPDQLYQNVDVFRALADLRKRLNNTSTFAKAAAEVNGWAGMGGKRVSRTSVRRSRSGAPAAGAKLSDFARLTGIAPDLDTGVSVDKMLQRIIGPLVQKAPDPKKDKLVAAVDEALSDLMRALLHQPDFQNLESLWRGMDMLLRRIETGPMLQVLLVDVSAEEFAADLASSSDLSDTGLYQMLVEKPSQEKNGGVQLICGLYNFETTPPHAELLGRMAKIAKHAGAPFVTAMSPDALVDRRNDPHELIVAALQALRELPEATHLSLLAPRFLLRHPYGKRSDPISSFSFEEFTAADGLRGMLWGHPSILAACVLGAPRGNTNSIGDLPFHYMTDADGDQVALPCTERLINVDTARRLASFGLRALMSHKGQPEIRIAGLETMGATTLALAGAGKPAPRVQMTTTTLTSKVPEKDPYASSSRGGRDEEETATADGGDAPSDDASMDDLLASLGGDDGGSSDTSASSDSSGDSDLDALLASLGGDDATTTDAPAEEPAASDGGGGEEEMDPELAALLKSLE